MHVISTKLRIICTLNTLNRQRNEVIGAKMTIYVTGLLHNLNDD